jgi:hypothetical protein
MCGFPAWSAITMTNGIAATAMNDLEQYALQAHVGADRIAFVAAYLLKLPVLRIPDDVSGDACRVWIECEFARRLWEANKAYEAQEWFAAANQ